MESGRRRDSRICTWHSSFWPRVTDRQLLYHSHLRPGCSPLPSPHSWLTATSLCCQTRRGAPLSSSHKYPSNSMASPTGLTFRPQFLRPLFSPHLAHDGHRHRPLPFGSTRSGFSASSYLFFVPYLQRSSNAGLAGTSDWHTLTSRSISVPTSAPSSPRVQPVSIFMSPLRPYRPSFTPRSSSS